MNAIDAASIYFSVLKNGGTEDAANDAIKTLVRSDDLYYDLGMSDYPDIQRARARRHTAIGPDWYGSGFEFKADSHDFRNECSICRMMAKEAK